MISFQRDLQQLASGTKDIVLWDSDLQGSEVDRPHVGLVDIPSTEVLSPMKPRNN